MQLSLHADYALRVLLYLAAHPGRVVPTQEISDAYGISKNHLVRVVQTLGEHGYATVTPGRFGGVSLALEPRLIRLGQVVRNAEPNLHLVECFDHETNSCPIIAACELKPVLREALQSFLDTMDRYTLHDLLANGASQKLTTIFAAV
jgi:Rrf2 family nitric oxide-sensitive transcriptional repressor